MRVPSTALRVLTSLRLGERVLVRSDDGLLPAEYALFDVTDIVLRATDPVSVREAGYLTTAEEALTRLARSGVTPALAAEAARSLSSEVAASFALGETTRGIVSQLTAYELFDGAIYSAAAQSYEGAWLDLAALAHALPLPGAAVLLQVLHLVTALSEVEASTPVHMSTAAATRDRRPGERTHSRTPVDGALALPSTLRRLGPQPTPREIDPASERRIRQALLVRLRERASTESSPRLRAHLTTLENALAMRTMQIGPMADGDLRAIERQLAAGDASGIDEQLDQLEHTRGRLPGIRYLRARAALLRGDEPPRSVAQLLSELAHEEQGFHEAELGAARTWLAAGEDANARFFAHRLANNPAAPESERLLALEILDETTGASQAPPPVDAGPGYAPTPPMAQPRVPLFPSLGNVPPPAAVPQMGSVLPPPVAPSAAPPAGAAPGPRVRPHLIVRYDPELVESLALPLGATEASLGVNDLPRTPIQARVAMTRLARDLARDYRLWYGKSLRCNVLAVDAMQQHLSHRFAGADITNEKVAWELRRHGSLLSEILSRALGGVWVDVGPSEPGFWAMVVPPSTRLWPIGRVYRFVALGNRERDLVSYYVDLEARVRKAHANV